MRERLTRVIQEAIGKVTGLGPAGAPNNELEQGFQTQLCDLLNASCNEIGWTWRREVKYKTRALRNNTRISIDIMGQSQGRDLSAAIELKYVPTKAQQNVANDVYAFPYDVLKDAVKIELVSAGMCDPANSDVPHDLRYGFVIGLTNVPAILNPDQVMSAWSRNYREAIHGSSREKTKDRISIGPKLIHTVSDNDIDRVIYFHRRHHISLGAEWKGGWSDHGESGFQYLMLSSDFLNGPPEYKHDKNDSAFIPFLTLDARQSAADRAKHYQPIQQRYSSAVGVANSNKDSVGFSGVDLASEDVNKAGSIGQVSVKDKEHEGRTEILRLILVKLRSACKAFGSVRDLPDGSDQIQAWRQGSFFSIRLRLPRRNFPQCSVALRFGLIDGARDCFVQEHHDVRESILHGSLCDGIVMDDAQNRDTFLREVKLQFCSWVAVGDWSRKKMASMVFEEIVKFMNDLEKGLGERQIAHLLSDWKF